MKTVSVASFEAHCLALLAEVKTKKQTVILTKRGKAIAELVPVSDLPKEVNDIFDLFAGHGEIKGDLVVPTLDLEEWGNLA